MTAVVREGLTALSEIPICEGALDIWQKGGWAMYALLGNALIMFGMGAQMMMKLAARSFFVPPDVAWRRYIEGKKRIRSAAGKIIEKAMQCRGLVETEHFFEALRGSELHPFERDLPMMKVTVSAAPLLGLLGTVTGMLSTFGALATGAGGDKTMNMVAGGISEALITTETGLLLALAGLMFQSALVRQHERYDKAITHLETLCLQHFRRDNKAMGA